MQESSQPNTTATPPRGLQLHSADNVAVVLADTEPGPIPIIGTIEAGATVAIEPIAQGHKLALRPIAEGEQVIKYGVAIGIATAPIEPGAWVHTHNCRSPLDQRSHTLDPHSGAPTDTRYS
jgi:SAF domain